MPKIHNPETYASLNEPQAQALCTDLATTWLKTDRFKTELARRIGATKEGVNNWFRPGNRPPVLVILYMQAEIERINAIETLMLAREVNKRLERI